MDDYSIANTTKEQRIALIRSWQPEDESFDEFYVYLFSLTPCALIDLIFCISYLRIPKESIMLCPDGKSLFLANYGETVFKRY